jgi:hypothetical protein
MVLYRNRTAKGHNGILFTQLSGTVKYVKKKKKIERK